MRPFFSAEQLRRQVSIRAGCVSLRYARATKLLVGVYKSEAANLDTGDGETPWSVLCEEHGAILGTRTRAEAMSSSVEPHAWCEDCRAHRGES